MDAEKLTTALYEKMKAEQNSYREWLVTQPPEKILDHAYEYTIREDILVALERDLTAPQAEALLASPSPLADLYKDWCKQETGYMDNIRDTIEGRADELIRQQAEIRKAPVYKYPGEYAREHDELELYRASGKANIACKEAVETAVNGHYNNNCLDTKAAVREVVERFGYERMLYVLAVTVGKMDWDGRISRANKNWARTTPIFEDKDGLGHDRNTAFVVSKCHPGLTDMFVTEARHEYLLSLPLTKEDIKTEALNILSAFQNATEPNSPNGTHYMAQISPDFLARANTKDTDRLMAMLPFQTLSLSGLEGHKGRYALISKDENRFQKLVLRRPSVRKKLQEQPDADAPKPPAKGRNKVQER